MSDHQSAHCSFVHGFSSFFQRLTCWRHSEPEAVEVNPVDALHPQSVAFADVPIGGSFQADRRVFQKVSTELALVLRVESGESPRRRLLVRFDESRRVVMLNRREQDRVDN